jgi:hypothetical protein
VGLQDAREVAVKNLFAQHGVPIEVIPAKSKRPDLYYKIDGHWHARGHAFVASRLLEALGAFDIVNR